MIELTNKRSNYLDFEKNFSLEKILYASLGVRYSTCEASFPGSCLQKHHNEPVHLKINSEVGNAILTISNLLNYPQLVRELRKIFNFPVYPVNICLDKIMDVAKNGLKSCIKALQSLDEILEEHRKEKAKIDAHVNNLVMLYGSEKIIPIYNGFKYYYTKHSRAGLMISISNVKYFSKLKWSFYHKKHYRQTFMFNLSAREILKNILGTCLDKNEFNVSFINDNSFIGGIVNTPILIFHYAKSFRHKGKNYYVDLHTNKIFSGLSKARVLAENYAGHNYRIELWEK